MTLTTEQLQAMRAGCMGIIDQGPYVVCRDDDDASIRPVGEDGPGIWTHLATVDAAFEDVDGAGEDACDPDEWCTSQRKLAHHIARCDPQTIAAICDELLAAREQLITTLNRERETTARYDAKLAASESDNARLREALEPFADLYVDYIDGNKDQPVGEPCIVRTGRNTNYTLNIGHFRRARAALDAGRE